MKNAYLILISFAAAWGLLAINLSSHNGPEGRTGVVLDEYGYTQAARNFIAGTPTFNPEHPPMAKYFIAAGITALGDNPWGWRIASTLFGALAVSMMLAWVFELTGSRRAAITAALLLALNNFWFVMSRLAMLPIFSFSLSLVGLYCYSVGRRRGVAWTIASGAAMGAAVCCRWSAVAVLAITCLLYCKQAKRLLCFVSAAIATYSLGFVPLMLRDPSQRSFVGMNLFILHFHEHATGNRFMAQPWYEWVFRTQPWDAMDFMVANPVITFFGLAALVVALYYKEYLPVALYAGNLGLWATTARPFEYYYYYLEAFSFLAPAIAIALWRLNLNRKLGFRPEVAIVGLALAGFIYHYGAMTALPANWDFTLPTIPQTVAHKG